MTYFNLTAIVSIALFIAAYAKYLQFSTIRKNELIPKGTNYTGIIYILGFGLLFRLLLSFMYYGYKVDMNCFYSWSSRIADTGFSGFYDPEVFADYPPGYMYVLYIIGHISKALGLPYSSGGSVMLLKLPAILCDIGAGYLIYKFARRKFTEQVSLVLTLFYLFNPAIIINSTIWGQVDSVMTLGLLLMCNYIIEHKLKTAIVVYAIGIIVKPQMAIFTPILLFICIEQCFIEYHENRISLCFRRDKFIPLFITSLTSIAGLALICLPFGLSTSISKFFDTLGSYEHVTVNAYNMWAMFGLNWVDQTEKFLGISYVVFGYFFIVLIVVSSFILFIRLRKNPARIFVVGAFIIISMFVLSVRMHERYMYPGLVLLLFAFIRRPNNKTFFLYGLFSFVHFYNVGHVLLTYENFSWDDPTPIIIGALTVIIYIMFIYVLIRHYWFEKTTDQDILDVDYYHLDMQKAEDEEQIIEKSKIERSKKLAKMTTKDYLIMFGITAIYTVIAFYDLGYRYAPLTNKALEDSKYSIVLDLGETTSIKQIGFYNGNYHSIKYEVSIANDMDGYWETLGEEYEMDNVFCWDTWDVELNTRYIRLTSKDQPAVINELVFVNENNELVTPKNASDYAKLFDEQVMFDPDGTFRTSTYFDEIYHARTAYEFIEGLETYEWTHPPMGKTFIAAGVKMFGMNPFGWRFMGTVFGVIMLPCIYIFGKKLFSKTWIATIVILLFAADFMHFAQTRIATIDVFVTLFIILMYYFMYLYTSMSFYDTKLYKTFVPLAFCGISMGFGIASKMTGVYAAAGLAIIFFIHLGKRYMEYLYAKSDISGSTEGISHAHVVKSFIPNTVKTILFCVLVFIVIPAIIYTLSYIPFVDSQSNGLIDGMLRNQTEMFNYHVGVTSPHSYSSIWLEWPIMKRPIYYYANTISGTVAEGISSFGNPLIWWGGIPAFLYLIYIWYKYRDKGAMFLIIGYCAQYLPWSLITRITFIYHYFPSVPFVILMIVYAFYDMMKRYKNAKNWLIAFTILAIIFFVLFYPVLSGQPVSKWYVGNFLKWFPSWTLLDTYIS